MPEEKQEACRQWAESTAAFFKDYDCLEVVEAWEDFVPSSKQTDFRRAVAARPREKIGFVWQVWLGKETFQAAAERMHRDDRMDASGEPPFDAGRIILGCFQPIAVMSRNSP